MKLPGRNSIAFRLIAAVLAVELFSAVLVGFLSLGYERHNHFHAFDTMLRGRADSVLGAVQDAEDKADNVMLDRADLHLPHTDVYEVWDDAGHLLGRSDNWQGCGEGYTPQKHDVFKLARVNGHEYRIIRRHGSRIVDPVKPGGGRLRRVMVVYGAPVAPVWQAIWGTVDFYAAGSLLLLLVTGPLIAWLLHRGLLPLRQLAALAADVSVDAWQFTPPPSAYRTPELAPLTHALESVLARLERAFVQQRTFVSDAAHELKTAVAVIKSSLQLLNLRPRSAAEYQAGLERCLADAQRLEDLVAKMLTLARVESGGVLNGPAPASDLASCVQDTQLQLAPFAELRRVTVKTESPAICRVALSGEDGSLLVSNLMLNALQHSPAETEVRVHLRVEDGNAVLSVEDRGEGIDPAVAPHVFERFYRGDPSRARTTGGAGLGLAICKGIVDRAGGSIELASELERGTTMTVRLPLA